MASKDLYDLVSKTIQDGDNKISKVQIGYTVDSYKSVLSALQKAQAQMSKSEAISDGYIVRNPIFARWTEMSSINLGGVVNQADGFVVDGSGNYETYRQQRVKFLPFMTFVVRVKDEKGEMKPHIANFDSHIETLNRGESIALGGKVAYPPKDIDENSCSSIAMAVGGMSNSCEIGIAVDLTDGTGTADAFFQKCYPKVYKEGIGGKLASRRALMAEIAFVGGNKANTLHARVIANSGNTPSGSVHNAYIPIPLLLTNEYMTLADVEINIGQLVRIGTSDCDYPFKGSKFNHKNCSLDGFTPQYFKDIIKNKLSVADTKVKFASASQGDNFGYIRFYIDKEKEAQISDCLAIDIPEEYKVEIFKGIGEADIAEKVIGYETGTTSSAFQFSDEGMYYPEDILKPMGISREQFTKSLQIVWDAEGGKIQGDWSLCEDVGDGAGISYGAYQWTEKSGLLARLVKKYLEKKRLQGELIGDDATLAGCPLGSGSWSQNTLVHDLGIMSALKGVAHDPLMIQSQHELFVETRVQPAVEKMKKCGMTSALGYASWAYIINHGWSTSYYAPIIAAQGEAAKCEALVSAHIRRLQTLSNWDKYKNGWMVIFNAYLKAARNNNINLDIPQKWRNYII